MTNSQILSCTGCQPMMEGNTASFRLSIAQFYRCGMTKVVDQTNVSFIHLLLLFYFKNCHLLLFAYRMFHYALLDRAIGSTTTGSWSKVNHSRRNPSSSSADGCRIIRNVTEPNVKVNCPPTSKKTSKFYLIHFKITCYKNRI